MKKAIWRALIGVALLAPLLGSTASYGNSSETAHLFSATGHTVSDLFWQYWQAHGGLDLFGYPISDEFTETSASDGKPYTVQYFERAVFELHPSNPQPYTVQLTLLGSRAYKAKYPNGAPGQQASSGGQLFAQTGHSVGGRLLQFWQSHDGLANLGYPLSDEFSETSAIDGKPYTVQYFERAVLELHPANQPPYDVLLSQLGTLQRRQLYPNGAPQQPTTSIAGPAAQPGDWPMYAHDPQHTNYNAAEKTISAANVDQLVSLWQADIGASTAPPAAAPSVANGRVYVGSGVKSGDNFFAFNTADGAKAWSVNLGYKDICYNVGIGATPAISGSLVVAGGGDGAFYGLDSTTGAIRWRDETDRQPENFAWTSPLFVNGRVVYGVASYCDDPPSVGEVRSADAASGSLRNLLQLVPNGAIGGDLWQSPALSADGNTLILATGELRGDVNQPYSQALLALDPTSFAVRASNHQAEFNKDLDWGTSPIIFHDAAGRDLVGAASKDNHFFAYELNNISAGPIWSKHITTQIGLMAAYDPDARPGGILFVPSTEGVLYAVDPATGADIWVDQGLRLDTAHGNIALANGLIFMNITRQGLVILDEQTGAVLRRIAPANLGRSFSGISVANGVIYFLSGQYLNAWGLPPNQ